LPEERVYVVPLRRVKLKSRPQRAPTAVREVRAFLRRHLKTDSFTIDESVNRRIWGGGIQHIPSRIRIKVTEEKVEGEEEEETVFRVSLAE